MGDPGKDEEKHQRDTYSCYIELRPVSGQQHNLTNRNTVIRRAWYMWIYLYSAVTIGEEVVKDTFVLDVIM